MMSIAQGVVVLFGIFILYVGIMMLFFPEKARATLRKAGSTNLINYAEITLRMIPAIAMIIYGDHSRYPDVFSVFGWFMLGTSIVLYFVPRKLHHAYSLKSADILQPLYFRFISPFALAFGIGVIYSVI